MDQLLRSLLQDQVVSTSPTHQRVPHSLGQAEVQTTAWSHNPRTDLASKRFQTRTDPVRPLAVGRVSSIAEHWERCEPRGSCAVLREPEGATPSGHSPRPAD